jgi:histidine ammonia-lyase
MRSDPRSLAPPGNLVLDGGALDAREVVDVARAGRKVEVSALGQARVAASRADLEQAIADGEVLYGVNTGFGSLARERIEGDRLREIQKNLILSHAAGVGEALPDDVVRAMLLLLVGSLCRGLSGVRPIVVDNLVGLLNAGVTPRVPSVGSVGASGDLAPLAHAALVLLGEGEAMVEGQLCSGREALSRAGLQPLELEAKEGLALIRSSSRPRRAWR